MSGLTREETANPVFKGENRRPERGREKQRNKHIYFLFSADHEQRDWKLCRIKAQSAGHGQSLYKQVHVLVARLDNLTVSLLFVVWIREFHFWPNGFIMVSVAESKRTRVSKV